jgi:hypothetical protein
MANDGRPMAKSEDYSTMYRLYPIKGQWIVGATVIVNADGDLEFGTGSLEGIVDDTSAEFLFDDASGDVVYDG